MASRLLVASITGLSLAASPSVAANEHSFAFEHVEDLAGMQELIRTRFNIGATREELRQLFVVDGRATFVQHPSLLGTEKYIYDINLCSYYIWRWNVSVDFDDANRAIDIYINGESVFYGDDPSRAINVDEIRANDSTLVALMQRLRPEAHKGESSLGFIIIDADGDIETVEDQFFVGGGPTRPDPINMGQLHGYQGERWRSIFDGDDAEFIADYQGDCAAVDAHYEGLSDDQP